MMKLKLGDSISHLERKELIAMHVGSQRRNLTAQYLNGRVVFSGGAYGDHTISDDSSHERILAHWKGYVEATART